MRTSRYLVPIFTAAVLAVSSPVWAQGTHIASPAALQQAVQAKVTADAADRAVILRVLKSSEARVVAERLGLNVTKAESRVAALEGKELQTRAADARAAEAALSGKSNVVVISTTTLLLLLIILILILK